MREKFPTLFPRKERLSQGEELKRAERARKEDQIKGERRAEKEKNIQEAVKRRRELSATFEPGEFVVTGGREGVVTEPDQRDIKLGNVRVRFGRSKPVSCNPEFLEKKKSPE